MRIDASDTMWNQDGSPKRASFAPTKIEQPVRGKSVHLTPSRYGGFSVMSCPYCLGPCEADWVDVGPGYVQCGPYHCDLCGASEIGPSDSPRELNEEEREFGWYRPESPPGDSANTIDGKLVSCEQALGFYRQHHFASVDQDPAAKVLDGDPDPMDAYWKRVNRTQSVRTHPPYPPCDDQLNCTACGEFAFGCMCGEEAR